MSRATVRTLLAFVALAVAVFALPAFVNDFRAQQFAYVGIYLVALIGLNILTGYAGQLSLGTAAFMAVGAFAAYNFVLRVPGIPILAAIPAHEQVATPQE